MSRPLRRALRGLALVLLMAVATACQADVLVTIQVGADGAGTLGADVRLDADAVAALGDTANLRTADLAQAGWQLDEPEIDSDGGVVLRGTREVASPDQWQAALDSLFGPGVFTNVRVERQLEFARQDQSLFLDVDASGGWELLADDAISDAFGEPAEVVFADWADGRTLGEVVDVTVDASVSSREGDAPSTATWAIAPGASEVQQIALQSTAENTFAVLLRWIGYAFASLFALALVLAGLGLALERRADRLRGTVDSIDSLGPRVPAVAAARSTAANRGASVTSGPAGAESASEADAQVRMVLVDPLKVLYQPSMELDAHVMPFVEHNRGTAARSEVREALRLVTHGRIDTAEFWRRCGVPAHTEAEVAEVDEVFIDLRRLRPDALDFLTELQRRRIPVAVLTEDASTWSAMTRERDALSGLWPWIVSADASVSRATPGLYEQLRRESGVAFGHCLFVDTELDSLNLASSLGMRTALVASREPAFGSGRHRRVPNLGSLFRRRL